MAERVPADLMQRFRSRIKQNGAADADLTKYPVGIVRGGLIPFTGNVHVASDRIVERKQADQRFKKLKF